MHFFTILNVIVQVCNSNDNNNDDDTRLILVSSVSMSNYVFVIIMDHRSFSLFACTESANQNTQLGFNIVNNELDILKYQ